MAISALRRVFQVYWRSTFRTVDLPDLCPHFGQFRSGKTAHELLFAQKLHEGRESPITSQTAVVGEASGLAQIETLFQLLAASRTVQVLGKRLARRLRTGMDLFEQLEHRTGRQLNAGQMIEPYAGAGQTVLDAHCAVIILLKIVALHRLTAARAWNLRKCVVCHDCRINQFCRRILAPLCRKSAQILFRL